MPDAAAAERIGLATVGGVAVADVERLQRERRVRAGDAAALRCGSPRSSRGRRRNEPSVVGWMSNSTMSAPALERRPASTAACSPGTGCLRRMHAGRRAGVILKALAAVGLRQAAVGEQHRSGRPVEHQPRRVVEIDEGREQTDARGTRSVASFSCVSPDAAP